MDEREVKFEEECEKLLMETYDFLNKLGEYLPQVTQLLVLCIYQEVQRTAKCQLYTCAVAQCHNSFARRISAS